MVNKTLFIVWIVVERAPKQFAACFIVLRNLLRCYCGGSQGTRQTIDGFVRVTTCVTWCKV